MRAYRGRTIVRGRVCKPDRPGLSGDPRSLILPSEHRLQVLRGKLRSDARHRKLLSQDLTSADRSERCAYVRERRKKRGADERRKERDKARGDAHVVYENADDIHAGRARAPKGRSRLLLSTAESSSLDAETRGNGCVCIVVLFAFTAAGFRPAGLRASGASVPLRLGKGRPTTV
jgi:hypothetical protein